MYNCEAIHGVSASFGIPGMVFTVLGFFICKESDYGMEFYVFL